MRAHYATPDLSEGTDHMTPEWAQVLVSIVTVTGVCFTAWMAHGARGEARRAGKVAGTASRHAEQAAEYGKPTGNGFAEHVRQQLSDIATIATDGRDAALRAEDKADAANAAVQRHLEAHANHGLSVIVGGERG